MNLVLMRLGFDPVALMRRARRAGLARVGRELKIQSSKLKNAGAGAGGAGIHNSKLKIQSSKVGILGGERLGCGVAKARILSLQVGEVIAVAEVVEINKWRVLASRHGVHLTKVDGGLQRTAAVSHRGRSGRSGRAVGWGWGAGGGNSKLKIQN